MVTSMSWIDELDGIGLEGSIAYSFISLYVATADGEIRFR